MLKTKDLTQFKEFMETGGWADAFANAEEDLRLEMIEKIEELLDAADVADKVVGEILFSQEGLPQADGDAKAAKASAWGDD